MAVDTELKWYGESQKKDTNKGVIVALTRSINLVQSTAKTLTPVDTGNLRDSIVKRVDPKTLTASTGTNTEYAPYVEFGLRTNPIYPVQPYLRPGLKDNKNKIKNIFIKEVGKTVD